MGMMRSPSAASLAAGQQNVLPHKNLKFVRVIHLSAVRRLVDILDQEDCDASVMSTSSTITYQSVPSSNLVAIVCRQTEDLRETCYTLQLVVDSQDDKWSFLKTMCRHGSNTLCRPDPDQLLIKLSARDMSLDASDLNVSTFSRALSSFHKTKQKVGRAFSFNKTPSKLKRAVSTVISPLTSSAKLNRTQHLGGTPADSLDRRTEHDCQSVGQLSPGSRSVTSCVSLTTPMGSTCPNISPGSGSYAGSYQGPQGHKREVVSPYGQQGEDTVSVFCRSVSSVSAIENVLSEQRSVDGGSVSVDNVSSANNQDQGRTTPLTSRAMVAQSCVDLMEAESPRSSSRSFPKKLNFTQESPRQDAENRNPDFRTPNLCSRPSFRDKFRSRPRAGTLGGFTRKGSVN